MNQILDDELSIKNIRNILKTKTLRQLFFFSLKKERKKERYTIQPQIYFSNNIHKYIHIDIDLLLHPSNNLRIAFGLLLFHCILYCKIIIMKILDLHWINLIMCIHWTFIIDYFNHLHNSLSVLFSWLYKYWLLTNVFTLNVTQYINEVKPLIYNYTFEPHEVLSLFKKPTIFYLQQIN